MVGLAAIFVLGICNFALNKAVLESGHPLLAQMGLEARGIGERIALGTEFLVLLTAMMLAANGYPALVWVYVIYSAINLASAWFILTNRM